jgi:hypothetical protein
MAGASRGPCRGVGRALPQVECARAVAEAEAEGRDEFQTCGECTQILPLLIAGIQLAQKTDVTTTFSSHSPMPQSSF